MIIRWRSELEYMEDRAVIVADTATLRAVHGLFTDQLRALGMCPWYELRPYGGA